MKWLRRWVLQIVTRELIDRGYDRRITAIEDNQTAMVMALRARAGGKHGKFFK